MSDLQTALAKPPPEQRDGKIQFDSLQPTIHIVPRKAGGVRYLVYVGHRVGSQAKEDLIWGQVKLNGNNFFVQFTRDVEVNLAEVELFAQPHMFARWVLYLSSQLGPRDPARLGKWQDKRDFVRNVVRLALEDCLGDAVVLTSGRYGSFSLRQINRGLRPPEIRNLIYNGPGIRPRYYHPSYSRNQLQPVTTKVKAGNKAAVRKRVGAAGEPTDKGSTNNNANTQAAGHEVEDHAVIVPNSNSVPPLAGSQDSRLESANLVADNTLVMAETERIIIRPAKEKAIDMIEQDVRDWYDGTIDEDTLEKSFQARLSDVRLARQMQETLLASKTAGNNARKRKADDINTEGSAERSKTPRSK
ncbi:hypothetical protein LTR10_022838 [Elasticomyces elasticus]|uniref:Uncharacterized protein n=1 Tax=Exophiala sideris TaxID=1016849 RepID=A0ABR0JAE1_9EURO|nr:hypothetical protein LTR10_022838 [Elasticomyces elasticus]KAK5026178.1 hypothetical protein LTS07_007703 [Exophiala sideris]KAK5032432.1 hypothetical protein LTR13_007255 [Exophiala sideris]KAK5059588.1 hypothetical protein LTR69_006177 [Exophiala sideris]KAK5178129.1 hypothetical protein LTR44_009435 [Eurotiomycetes sp. CCFEE 6388]